MTKSRFGVALVVDEPISRDINVLRRSLGDGSLDRIMPHVTLVPPVNVADERIDECLSILESAAAETSPFTVLLNDVETFLPDNPVIFLTVKPEEDVRNLRLRVFREPLAKPEDHEFVPHLTICDDASEEKIAASIIALAEYRQEITFDRVHLLQKDSGEPWRSVADFIFSAKRVVGTGGLPMQLDIGTVLTSAAQDFLDREWRPYLNTQLGPNRLIFEPLTIIARRENKVVGVVQAELRAPSCYLRELFIGAETRGQGVASHLLAALEDVARQKGCTRLTYVVLKDCEVETYFRSKGWGDDVGVVVEQFGRPMSKLAKNL